jgi:NADH:ubiquinone oxidoreductase subunit E
LHQDVKPLTIFCKNDSLHLQVVDNACFETKPTAVMTSPITEIVICMGSSCFSRGNRKTLPYIKEFLKERNIQAQVLFKGSHCFGSCERGPMLQINGKVFEQVDPNQVGSILEAFFEKTNQDQK